MQGRKRFFTPEELDVVLQLEFPSDAVLQSEFKRELLNHQREEMLEQGILQEQLNEMIAASEREARKKQLTKYFRQSPIKAYNNTFTTPRTLAYSHVGLFGVPARKRVEQDIQELADGRLPYVDQHLKVMDEIKNRRKFG